MYYTVSAMAEDEKEVSDQLFYEYPEGAAPVPTVCTTQDIQIGHHQED